MNKVIEFTKNHFVEVLGFTAILVIIILISYLKMYKKTFVCELRTTEGTSKIYQKYTIKQTNNKLKSIHYYYRAKTPDSKTKKEMSNFYHSMISENEDKLFENDIKLTFKDDKLVLSYDLNLKELKNNKNFKKASRFIKSVKANGFTCK